jgi:hypothetical protein
MKKLDLGGQQFGRWHVLEPAERTYQTMWLCECVCGTRRPVSGANLRDGSSTSCGCYRAENPPDLLAGRDHNGAKNPRARVSIANNGGVWVPSSSAWYKRAAGVFYSAKKRGLPLEFDSAAELASYVMSIAPEKCPVFGEKFTDRGAGYSKWAPSIDKINPELGYVRGNIQVISMLANCMKRDATPEQLCMFAAWIGRNAVQ